MLPALLFCCVLCCLFRFFFLSFLLCLICLIWLVFFVVFVLLLLCFSVLAIFVFCVYFAIFANVAMLAFFFAIFKATFESKWRLLFLKNAGTAAPYFVAVVPSWIRAHAQQQTTKRARNRRRLRHVIYDGTSVRKTIMPSLLFSGTCFSCVFRGSH